MTTNPPSHFLELLVGASLRAAALILLLLALRALLRRSFGSPLVSLLWLMVLVRLLVPWSAEVAWHPLALPERVTKPLATTIDPWKVRVSVQQGTGEVSKPLLPAGRRPHMPWDAIFLGVWATGTAVALVFFGVRCWRTSGLARRAVPANDPRLQQVLHAIPNSIRRRTELRITDEIPVAALLGIWRPQILLPREWTSALSEAELRHVLLHELGHARRGDLLAQWLFAVAQCVHWFNPFVWLASRQARADAELACDAWVLAHGGEQERSSYGDTLLRTSQLFRDHGVMAPGGIGMAASRHTLVARVREVSAFRPVARWQAIIGLIVAVTLAGAWMTRPISAQETPATPAAPAASSPPPAASTAVKPEGEAKPAATPNPAAASPVLPDQAAPSTQVEIEAKFFELSEATAKGLNLFAYPIDRSPVVFPAPDSRATPQPARTDSKSAALASEIGSVCGVFTPEEAKKFVQRLSTKKEVDLIAAPRVTTKSGQKAVIEIVREFRYATEYAPDEKTGKPVPTAYASRNLGVTLEAEPVIGPDGYTIDLNLVPQVVELEGFMGTDGQTIPLRGGRGVGANLTASDIAGISVEKHGILQPIFSDRKVTTSVSIWAGQTVILGGMKRELKEKGKAPVSRLLYVLISARFVNPDLPPAAHGMVSPAPTTNAVTPVPAQSTPDKKEQVPTALPAEGGYVRSPFAPDAGLIDVHGFAPGTKIKCPYTGNIFKTP